ncbi:hypothetical protein YC2023_091164 [Brassica napus]
MVLTFCNTTTFIDCKITNTNIGPLDTSSLLKSRFSRLQGDSEVEQACSGSGSVGTKEELWTWTKQVTTEDLTQDRTRETQRRGTVERKLERESSRPGLGFQERELERSRFSKKLLCLPVLNLLKTSRDIWVNEPMTSE